MTGRECPRERERERERERLYDKEKGGRRNIDYIIKQNKQRKDRKG